MASSKFPHRHAFGPLAVGHIRRGKETNARIRRWSKRVQKRILDIFYREQNEHITTKIS